MVFNKLKFYIQALIPLIETMRISGDNAFYAIPNIDSQARMHQSHQKIFEIMRPRDVMRHAIRFWRCLVAAFSTHQKSSSSARIPGSP